MWETAFDVCFEWGFDLREIQTSKICIWHAQDDNACPSQHGAILRDLFQERGHQVDFQNPKIGFGHLTFNTEHYLKPENSIIKAMLERNQEPNGVE